MKSRSLLALPLAFAVILSGTAAADTAVNKATQANLAVAKYGVTGKKVIIAILDRGIDYTHRDFRNTDGTTRIKMMWDMSNMNPALASCDPGQPTPLVYTEAKINKALSSGTLLPERDAVGHGTVSTALAAGNGSALLPVSAQWAGLAPQADLLIVKMTSEGVPAHSNQPAEAAFQACQSVALDLVNKEAKALGEPIVALMNSGSQWGPIDNTSVVSQKINADFNRAGHVYVEASGDEGSLNNHARANFSNVAPAVFAFNKASTSAGYMQMWYSGAAPANVKLTMADNGASVTIPPGSGCANSSDNSITLCTYLPGAQFYPWTSSGPDRAVWMLVSGHTGAGSITVTAAQAGTNGTVDVYGDGGIPPVDTFTTHLTNGRLSDYASTLAAIVAGCFNGRVRWTDVNNNPQALTNQGAINDLWLYSSGGPTRDGRSPLTATYGGVDVVAPGGNAFAAYSPTSYWGDPSIFGFNLAKGGNGLYGRHSATSAAAPIVTGTVALLLQINPNLSPALIRSFLHQSAVADPFTKKVPNLNWGMGKLNVLGAADLAAATLNNSPKTTPATVLFPGTEIHTTSQVKIATLQNLSSATDPLTVTSVTVSGDYKITANACTGSLAPGAKCNVKIVFKPTATGTRTGTLTIKDFNPNSPHTIPITGYGQLFHDGMPKKGM